MATMVTPRQKLRSDHIFFPAMALFVLGIVFYGFAQSYFLAGMVRAKLPSLVVHIHGALFVSWIFLLLLQNALVATRHVKWHMRLGVLGVILPPLMIAAGFLTICGDIRRAGSGPPPEILLTGDGLQLVVFGVLICWGMLARRNPASHKRLMLLGTMAILAPAIDRWPALRPIGLPATIGVYVALPMLLVAYDLWSVRRIHRCTAVGYGMIVALVLLLIFIANSPLCHRFVVWIKNS